MSRPRVEKPLPCPFCGHRGVIEQLHRSGDWIATCGNGDCEFTTIGGPFEQVHEALKAWNTRPTKPLPITPLPIKKDFEPRSCQ